MDRNSFREDHALAWSFHRNTSRWAHNTGAFDETHFPEPAKEYLAAPFFELSEPRALDTSLGEAFIGRFSCRRFASRDLSEQELSTLLHAAYGVSGRSLFGSLEFLERPVPSAGGLYPLEAYLLARRVTGLEPGVYHYAPLHHAVELLREVLIPRPLCTYLFMGQDYVTDASAIVMLTVVVERTMKKYGDRGYRYALLEAGHVVQNINLTAAALDLGSCNIGGFFDEELADLLALDSDLEIPIYGVALGAPQDSPRSELRSPLLST